MEVSGVVEGALVEAGGDIIIAKGMNGMGKGVLNAKGNVVAKFLENATVTALGYVSSESILHSTVYAGDEITVSGKRGFITGGRVCATNMVSVKTLGSSMGADTIVEVGADPTVKVRIQNLQWDIANASRVPSLLPKSWRIHSRLPVHYRHIQYFLSSYPHFLPLKHRKQTLCRQGGRQVDQTGIYSRFEL